MASIIERLKAKKAAQAAAAAQAENSTAAEAAPQEEQKSTSSVLEALRRKRAAEAAVQADTDTETKAEAAPAEEEPKAADKPENSLQDKVDAMVNKIKNAPADEEADKAPTDAEEVAETAEIPAAAATEDESEPESADTAEESNTQETAEEDAAPEGDDTEETEDAEKAEAPKKKSRRSRKKSKKDSAESTASDADTPTVAQCTNYDILGKKFSYDEMSSIVLDYFEDDGWKEMEKEINERVDALRVESDMNTGTMKVLLSEIDALLSEVYPAFIEQKKMNDALCDKEFGAAVAYQALHSVGANSEERKKNGYMSLASANMGGRTVNMLALVQASKMRMAFLNETLKRINHKYNTCITMTSNLNIESRVGA